MRQDSDLTSKEAGQMTFDILKVKKANIRIRYTQVPHLTQDTNMEK